MPVSSWKRIVVRVYGPAYAPLAPVPLPVDEDRLVKEIRKNLSEEELVQLNFKVTIVPSCQGDDDKHVVGLVDFRGNLPEFLSPLNEDRLRGYQMELEDSPDGLMYDQHFHGFTQLYKTRSPKPITADIICIGGLSGHAHGSWQGSGELHRMWLRDFLKEDLPDCRTMIYGYNSDLSVRGRGKLEDYSREFKQSIMTVRSSEVTRKRPLIFVAHSFGGLILVRSLIKDLRNLTTDQSCIYAATYGFLFFGVPHRGMDMENLIEILAREKHPRLQLIEELKPMSSHLAQMLDDFRNSLKDRKMVSFYETQETRALQRNSEGKLERTGESCTYLDSSSALMEMPDETETKVPLDGDHSSIIKFDMANEVGYLIALKSLIKFGKFAPDVVKARLSCSPYNRPMEPEIVKSLCTVPFVRDTNFVGRREILNQLVSYLAPATYNAAALVGLGGVGKSQIAIECAYRLREREPRLSVFWVFGASERQIESSLFAIDDKIKFDDREKEKVDIMSHVFRWLDDEANGNWLVILDNADDWNILDQQRPYTARSGRSIKAPSKSMYKFIPQVSHGKLLVTSRDRSIGPRLIGHSGLLINVKTMDNEDSLELLKTIIEVEADDTEDAQDLVQNLDHFPLAIAQAGAYIRQQEPIVSIQSYLSTYRESAVNQHWLLQQDLGDTRRDSTTNSITMTWLITFQHLNNRYPNAAILLELMSMFKWQQIPCYLIDSLPDHKELPHIDPSRRSTSHYLETNELRFLESITHLRNFSLISVADAQSDYEMYEMHRLVRFAMHNWLKAKGRLDERKILATHRMHICLQQAPGTFVDSYRVLLPHVDELVQYEVGAVETKHQRADMLDMMAIYLKEIGQYGFAKEYWGQAIVLWKQACHENNVLMKAGQLPTSEPSGRSDLPLVLERSLVITESSYAKMVQREGKPREAEELLRRCLKLGESILPSPHATTMIVRDRLTKLLLNREKVEEAVTLASETMAQRQKEFGEEYALHFKTFQLRVSAALQREPRTIDKVRWMKTVKELLSHYPDSKFSPIIGILKIGTLLATRFCNDKDYDEAEELQSIVLERQRKIYQHQSDPRFMREMYKSIANLAEIRQGQGKVAEALQLMQEVRRARITRYGSGHHLILETQDKIERLRRDPLAPKTKKRRLVQRKRLRKRRMEPEDDESEAEASDKRPRYVEDDHEDDHENEDRKAEAMIELENMLNATSLPSRPANVAGG